MDRVSHDGTVTSSTAVSFLSTNPLRSSPSALLYSCTVSFLGWPGRRFVGGSIPSGADALFTGAGGPAAPQASHRPGAREVSVQTARGRPHNSLSPPIHACPSSCMPKTDLTSGD